MDEPRERFPDIYDYILTEETDFKTRKITLAQGYDWNMWKHIERSYLFKNSQFTEDNNSQEKTKKPFNNVILPIANVNYRSEGFDVKDVELYVDNSDYYHLSLLGKKYYHKWAIENKLDTAIDESVVSYFDYGLSLIKNVFDKRPEIVQPQQIAFADQTDILSGPICLKHNMSISELLDMKGKWYDTEIDKAVTMARFTNDEKKTPGKYIEVYELHGMFPETWLGAETYGDNWEDTGKYSSQIHIVTYYVNQTDRTKNGICLFKGKEPKSIFKALKRDDVYGRACGRGGIEELFHSQIWTNWSWIQMQQMLEAVSKVVHVTDDKKLASQNNLSNIKHGQIIKVDEGKTVTQLSAVAPNYQLFDNFMNKIEQAARTIGSASDPQLGLNPVSGTPLGTTEIVTTQGIGIHEYRQGQLATFWHEIHLDWIMGYLTRDLNRGDEWLDELDVDELKEVARRVSVNQSNKKIKDLVLSGKKVTKEEQAVMMQFIQDSFMKGGKKRFMKTMKDEFSKLPLKLKFNIKNKQKNLPEMVAKLNSLFRTLFTPGAVQVLQSEPGLQDMLNEILEGSGISPISLSGLTAPAEEQKPVKSPLQVKEPTSVV